MSATRLLIGARALADALHNLRRFTIDGGDLPILQHLLLTIDVASLDVTVTATCRHTLAEQTVRAHSAEPDIEGPLRALLHRSDAQQSVKALDVFVRGCLKAERGRQAHTVLCQLELHDDGTVVLGTTTRSAMTPAADYSWDKQSAAAALPCRPDGFPKYQPLFARSVDSLAERPAVMVDPAELSRWSGLRHDGVKVTGGVELTTTTQWRPMPVRLLAEPRGMNFRSLLMPAPGGGQ